MRSFELGETFLERTGFVIESVYGDFFRHDLQNDSSDMVWVARRGDTGR